MKRLLVFTGWYPKPDRPHDTPFVSQQVKIMKEYLPKLSGEEWRIIVWCELFPLDLANRYLRGREPYNAEWLDNDIKVLFRQSIVVSHRLKVNQNRLLYPRMEKTFLEAKKHLGGIPDIIWTVTLSSAMLWNSFKEGKNLAIPFFLQEHSNPLSMHLNSRSKRKAGKKLAKIIDAVIVVAERQFKEFKALSSNYSPILIWNSVDEAFLPPPTNELKGQDLYFVGRLSREKGLSVFLGALSRVAKDFPSITFNVIGDGYLRKALLEEVEELQLSKKVRFLGTRQPEEISQILDQALIFVLPSEYENCPVALLEAQVRGVPCLIRKNNASEKVLLEGNGFAIEDNGDGKGLEKGLRKMLLEIDLYSRIDIRTRSIQEFAPVVFARRMYAVMNSIMK